MEQEKADLLRKIEARAQHDRLWGNWNMYFAQTLVIGGVLASFASTIAAASGKVPTSITAGLAAIPGCAIILDRSFNFMRLSRWHYLLAGKMDALAHALQFEGKSVAEISEKFSNLLLQFEERVPPFNVGSWSDTDRQEKIDRV